MWSMWSQLSFSVINSGTEQTAEWSLGLELNVCRAGQTDSKTLGTWWYPLNTGSSLTWNSLLCSIYVTTGSHTIFICLDLTLKYYCLFSSREPMGLVEVFRSASPNPASLPQGLIQRHSLIKILHKVFFLGNPKH